MASKEQVLQKERSRALGDLFVAECRAAQPNYDTLRTMLKSGANVCYKHAAALHWAAKKLDFELVLFLIDNGVLDEPISTSILANICNQKGFGEQAEPKFFQVLDAVRARRGDAGLDLFVPYINAMAAAGRLDKLQLLMSRYYLTEAEVAQSIYIRIIFEVILGVHDDMLAFINKHVHWQTPAALDMAVAGGDWVVLEYLLQQGVPCAPSETAVAQAVFAGAAEVLDILLHCGYSFDGNPLFLKKACRAAFNDGGRMLRYMLGHGYAPLSKYDGRTVRENALADGNAAVLAVLDEIG